MAVTVSPDRRFRRSQVHATRRRRLRARPIWRVVRMIMVLAALACGGYWIAPVAGDLPWLRVRHISLHGNRRAQSGELLVLLDGLTGDNMLTTDLGRWRERLFASAWVADATLRRRLPDTIEVEIREREPIGIARVGSELILMDAGGTVIDEYGPRYADCDLPVIDGLVRGAPTMPPAIDQVRSRLVSRLMSELRARPELGRRVSQIDVRDAHDVHVILDGDPAVIRLGDSQFVERLDSYVGLQAELRARVPEIDYVDLRFGDRVYVGPLRPGPLTPAPSAAAPPAPERGPGTQR